MGLAWSRAPDPDGAPDVWLAGVARTRHTVMAASSPRPQPSEASNGNSLAAGLTATSHAPSVPVPVPVLQPSRWDFWTPACCGRSLSTSTWISAAVSLPAMIDHQTCSCVGG
ncbi:hypothetical protein ACN47E_004295 [Coniothyrium glycines]